MKRLAILANARSGSSYLCDLLTQAGMFGRVEGFWLGPPHENYNLQAYWAAHQGAMGAARLSWFYLDWWWSELHRYAIVEELWNQFTHVLWLHRADKAAQAVSWYLADHDKQWSSSDMPRASPPPFEATRIHWYYASIGAFEARSYAFLQRPPDLLYEDMKTQTPQETVRAVLDFVEEQWDIPDVQPRLQPQHSDLKADYVARFREWLGE